MRKQCFNAVVCESLNEVAGPVLRVKLIIGTRTSADFFCGARGLSFLPQTSKDMKNTSFMYSMEAAWYELNEKRLRTGMFRHLFAVCHDVWNTSLFLDANILSKSLVRDCVVERHLRCNDTQATVGVTVGTLQRIRADGHSMSFLVLFRNVRLQRLVDAWTLSLRLSGTDVGRLSLLCVRCDGFGAL